MPRRTALGLALGSLTIPHFAEARGRTPLAGKVSLSVPFPLASIDPHRLDDPAAALFGNALFDTLFARDESGNFVPQLAESDPHVDGPSLRVGIRQGLKTAGGRPIYAGDVVLSLRRARSLGAKAWLADIPEPKLVGGDLFFVTKDATRLVRALASPLTAIVPRDFAADTPDGTGPFRMVRIERGIELRRNPLSARGASFLDAVTVRSVNDLESSLRAFEGGRDDIGWLGTGLHEPRPGAKTFDHGPMALAVLYTGQDAGSWDRPGVAQRLCDELMPNRLTHLGLGPAWTTEPARGWGGAPAALWVREDCAWLVELARVVAGALSRPSHEVSVRPAPADEIRVRKNSRSMALLLDIVRPSLPGTLGAYVSLLALDEPGQATNALKRAPRSEAPRRSLMRASRSGVVGEMRAVGGRVPDLILATCANGGIDWGASHRTRRAP